MSEHMIQLSKDFSRFPGGRFREDGPHSGQLFREDFLAPALERGDHITVILDDVAGLPASFLEEAFGGLIRGGFSMETLKQRLSIIANTPRLKRYPIQIWSYIDTAVSLVGRAT